MEGTISGNLGDEDPAATKLKAWFKVRKSLTRRALVGVALVGAVAGGLVEKGAADNQVADLQAQIAAMQDADTTGAGLQGAGSGAITIGVPKGQSKVTHPKAMSPGQSRYKCTRQDVG